MGVWDIAVGIATHPRALNDRHLPVRSFQQLCDNLQVESRQLLSPVKLFGFMVIQWIRCDSFQGKSRGNPHVEWEIR